jgi:hypothetical protein
MLAEILKKTFGVILYIFVSIALSRLLYKYSLVWSEMLDSENKKGNKIVASIVVVIFVLLCIYVLFEGVLS